MTDSSATDPTPGLAGLSEIADRYEAVLCDIWGVLHNGARGFPAAAQALRTLRKAGKPVALVTNAPRPDYEVAAHLASFGIGDDCYDAIATSGDVCARAIADRLPAKPFHLGPDRDLPVYDAASRMAGADITPVALEEAGFVVCTGLVEDTIETPADYEAVLRACGRKTCRWSAPIPISWSIAANSWSIAPAPSPSATNSWAERSNRRANPTRPST